MKLFLTTAAAALVWVNTVQSLYQAPPWLQSGRSYRTQTDYSNPLNMATAQRRVGGKRKRNNQVQSQSSSSGQPDGSNSQSSSVLQSATDAISDTVSAALSWDPTGILGDRSQSESNDLSAEPHNERYSRRRRRKNGKRKNRNRKKNRNSGSSGTGSGSRRKHFKPFWDDDDDDHYDYDEYDRDSGYSAPSSGYEAPSTSYHEPSSGYGAPSYEAPSSGYGAPSYSAPSYGGGGKDFDDFLNALAAFLPIALFLAAIPPNLVVVNDRKKRSLTDSSETSDNEELRSIEERVGAAIRKLQNHPEIHTTDD